MDFPPGDAQRPDVGTTWAALDRFWVALQRHMPKAPDPGHKCKTLERIERFRRSLEMANRRRHSPQALSEVLRIWDVKATMTPKWWADDSKERKWIGEAVTDLLTTFRDEVVTPFMDQWRQGTSTG